MIIKCTTIRELLINIAVACLSASTTTLLYNYLHQERNEVIFFHGLQRYCDFHRYKSTVNMFQTNECCICKVYRIIGWLSEARKSLDVCMYMLSHNLFMNAIIDAHKRGVHIRLILNEDNLKTTWKTGYMGIAKKIVSRDCGNNINLMHHKFIIIDNEKIILGSMNWTILGVRNNWENTFISNDHELVVPFVEEFKQLWEAF